MPTIQKSQLQVRPAAIPNVRRQGASSATAEGAALARANVNVGEAWARLGEETTRAGVSLLQRHREETDKATRQANELAIIGLDTKMGQWERDRLYDPEKGALTVKGEASFTLPEQIDKEFNDFAGELGKTAYTPEQQLAFERMKSDRGQAIGLTIRRHVDQQIQAYTAGQLQASIETSVQAAAANAMDPLRVKDEIDRASRSVEILGAQLGHSKEEIASDVLKARSAAHEAVIVNLVQQDQLQAAGTYFAAAREAGQIIGTRLDDIGDLLKVSHTKADAQQAADSILSKSTTLTEAREQAKQITDPEVRDATLSYIEHEWTVKKAEQRDAEEQQSKSVYDILDATKGNIRAIPAPLWATMSGSERRTARAYAEDLKGANTVGTGDEKRYYDLLRMAVDEPEKYANTIDLYKERGKFTRSQFDHLFTTQNALRKGDPEKAATQLDGYSSFTQLFNSATKGLGYEEGSDQERALRSRFEKEAAAEERAKGNKKLTAIEMQGIFDRLLTTLVVKDRWFLPDVTKRGIDVTIADVPATDKVQIGDALKRRGRPVTDETIVNYYLQMKAGQAK